jgi:hypothetical protein
MMNVAGRKPLGEVLKLYEGGLPAMTGKPKLICSDGKIVADAVVVVSLQDVNAQGFNVKFIIGDGEGDGS